jgi:exosortase
MFEQWSNDEDMSHGFFVPLAILWIVWRDRERWRALPAEPTWWGLAVLAAGAGMQIIAAFGGGLFAASVAFLISIAGAVLYFGGFVFLRAWALPFLLALFMLPKLEIVYSQVTLPLEMLASRIAAAMLWVAGVAVVREGNILDVAGHRISVQEACTGIRYLLSLGFIAVVYAYLTDSKPWMRFALLAVVVPIAIIANALRVAASGLVPALDAGTPHTVAGCLVFVLCLAALVLMRRWFHTVYARYHV